jgi:DNA-binding LacI/PurR family transcriptional regulator/signal transduction histidine kinase
MAAAAARDRGAAEDTAAMAYQSKSSGRRLRIGAFIGNAEGPYVREFWNGALERARERDAEIVGYLGCPLGYGGRTGPASGAAYGMAGPGSADGVIFLSSALAVGADPERISALVSEAGLPAVSVGYAPAGIPSVTADGTGAMRDIVRHLVAEHGRRSFALAAGPAGHPESMEREAAFRGELALSGLSLDDRLVYRGSFLEEDGAAAVRRFLEGGRDFDAIVCLNDGMALGASRELRERGLAAGFDAAVTGFDDIPEASLSWPSLTTVRQPAREMGREAVDALIELIERGEARSRALECSSVVRESCGCMAPPPLDWAEIGSARPLGEGEAAILGELEERAGAGDEAGALRVLERALALGAGDPELVPRWRSLLFALRGRIASGPSERGSRAGPAAWFDQALARLGEVSRRLEAERSRKSAERRERIARLGLELLGQFSLESLVRRWEACTAAMGIRKCYLILFESPARRDAAALPARARLVEPSPAREGLVETRFPTERLVPDEVRARSGNGAWIVEPLAFQGEALGYLLFEAEGADAGAIAALREIMSSAVKGALLLEETRQGERELERLVYFRTVELEEANRVLVGQIEQRRELEREIQEISNRTMQAIGQDLHDDLCPHLVGISMLASVLEEGLSSAGSSSVESAREIHELLRSAIDRSRQFARILYPPRLAEEGIASAVEDLVETQGRSAGGVSISLQTEGDCRIDDVDRSLNFFRIVQEALSNALRHSGSDDVIVRLVRREGSLLAEVRDYGRGMPPGDPGGAAAARGRGLGLRIMRYRAEAIGARLEICNLDPGMRVSCVLADG